MIQPFPSDPSGAEYERRRVMHKPTGTWALAEAMRGMAAQGLKPNDIAAAVGCDPATARNALAKPSSPAAAAATGPTAAAVNASREAAAGEPLNSPGTGPDVRLGCGWRQPVPGESSSNLNRSK